MTALTDDPRITVAWCIPCNRREAVHVDGRCLMADTHPSFADLHPLEVAGPPAGGPAPRRHVPPVVAVGARADVTVCRCGRPIAGVERQCSECVARVVA